MAATNTYIFTSATVAGITFTGGVSATIASGGGQVDSRCDSKQFQDVCAVTNVKETITVEGKAGGVITAIIGTKGAFSLVGTKNTGGVTLSGTRTAAGNCVITSISKGHDIDGNNTCRVTAAVYSSDGLASGIGWT